MLVQTAGALLIIVCFATQLSTQDVHGQSKSYLLNNLVGSAMVALTSIGPRQWGTVLLEGTWAAIAAFFLIRAVLVGRPAVIGGHLVRRRPPRRQSRAPHRPPARGRHRAAAGRHTGTPAGTSVVGQGKHALVHH